MLLRLRTRKTHLFMLHSRLCSTFNSGSTVVVSPNSNYPFPGEKLFRKPATEQTSSSISELKEQSLILTYYQSEKKWNRLTVSFFSLRDRYTADALLLSERIKYRQAFIDETINDLSLLSTVPVPPLLPQQTQEIIMSEKLKNLDKLNWLKKLKDLLVKQDEMSAELTNCRRTLLEEMVVNFSDIRHGRGPLDEAWPNMWGELGNRLTKLIYERHHLRVMETNLNLNPTRLSHRLKPLCEKIKTINRSVKLKEIQLNSTLTAEDVDDIFKLFSETSKPRFLNARWQRTWSELNKMWNELYERLMMAEVKESNPTSMMMRLEILRDRVKTINRFMRLKEMLKMEDELTAELTSSRVTSLDEIEEIINNFSEVPLLHDDEMLKNWNELNERVDWFRSMEIIDSSEFLSMRANSEIAPRGSTTLRLRSPTEQFGLVYQCWCKPPQLKLHL